MQGSSQRRDGVTKENQLGNNRAEKKGGMRKCRGDDWQLEPGTITWEAFCHHCVRLNEAAHENGGAGGSRTWSQ